MIHNFRPDFSRLQYKINLSNYSIIQLIQSKIIFIKCTCICRKSNKKNHNTKQQYSIKQCLQLRAGISLYLLCIKKTRNCIKRIFSHSNYMVLPTSTIKWHSTRRRQKKTFLNSEIPFVYRSALTRMHAFHIKLTHIYTIINQAFATFMRIINWNIFGF